jgi:cob(I)alamin adenosyltransferase
VLEAAFTQAGIAAEKVPGTVNKLQRALIEARDGAEAYQKVFSSLGLDPTKLLGRDPGAAFSTVARAIARWIDRGPVRLPADLPAMSLDRNLRETIEVLEQAARERIG